MLKEITKAEALNMYMEGSLDVQILICLENNKYCMYTMNEVLDNAKFLIDEYSEKDTSVPKTNYSVIENNNCNNDKDVELNEKEDEIETIDNAINKVKELYCTSNNIESTSSTQPDIFYNSHNDAIVTTIETDKPVDAKCSTNTAIKRSTKKIDLGKLYALRDAKWTYKQIANEFGCSISTIRKYAVDKKLKAQIQNNNN